MLDYMVDLETTGTDSSRNHIIQIAAVQFDVVGKTIGPSFDQCLKPAVYGRAWDEGTREWWTDQNWEVYKGIAGGMRAPEDVLIDFHKWVLETSITGTKIRFWSKPTSFDFPFLASYFNQFGLYNPFHYRYAKDLNTYIFAKGHTNVDAYWDGIEGVGDKHNALHDCFYQIRGLFNA